jgi:hypothetical protein
VAMFAVISYRLSAIGYQLSASVLGQRGFGTRGQKTGAGRIWRETQHR